MRYPRVALVSFSKEVSIPEGVKVSVEGDKVTVEGPKGKLERRYMPEFIDISVEKDVVRLTTYGRRKFNRAYLGTCTAHIRNMIRGVTEGFKREMIVAFAHFPVRVEVDESKKLVLIKNFLGGRSVRTAKIVGEVKVTVKDDRLIIEGISKEDVCQTAANIRQATRIKRKDPRVFQDGIYVVPEGMS